MVFLLPFRSFVRSFAPRRVSSSAFCFCTGCVFLVLLLYCSLDLDLVGSYSRRFSERRSSRRREGRALQDGARAAGGGHRGRRQRQGGGGRGHGHRRRGRRRRAARRRQVQHEELPLARRLRLGRVVQLRLQPGERSAIRHGVRVAPSAEQRDRESTVWQPGTEFFFHGSWSCRWRRCS